MPRVPRNTRAARILGPVLAASIVFAAAGAGARIETRQVYNGITGPQLDGVLRGLGYATRLTVDAVGDPHILSTIEGQRIAVRFYGCDKRPVRECRSVQFRATFRPRLRPSIARLNEWNRTRRYGYAMRHRDGAVAIKTDINLTGGTTRETIGETFAGFARNVAAFQRYIGQ